MIHGAKYFTPSLLNFLCQTVSVICWETHDGQCSGVCLLGPLHQPHARAPVLHSPAAAAVELDSSRAVLHPRRTLESRGRPWELSALG